MVVTDVVVMVLVAILKVIMVVVVKALFDGLLLNDRQRSVHLLTFFFSVMSILKVSYIC